jgi:hypothetical protein
MELVKHDELMAEWETDCAMDQTDVLGELYRCPILHSKYIKILQNYRLKQREYVVKYSELKVALTKYYSGEMNTDELRLRGWDQYRFNKPLKTQMEEKISAHPEVVKIENRVQYLETLIKSCESIIKEINNRTYLLRSVIDWQKFQQGVN